MIEQLHDGIRPHNDGTETMSDAELNKLNYLDFEGLHKAHPKLTVLSKDKKLDVAFCARITALVGTINLYMDSELSYTWCEASLIVAKSQSQGSNHARNLCTWIHRFLHHGKLPLHHYGRFSCSILNDEDFSQEIQLHLLEVAKDSYIYAQDVVDYVAKPETQERLGAKKTTISLSTAQRWMCKLDWRYGRKKNGMYIDGNEREDVVQYRKEFLARWQEYEKWMITYNNDGNLDSTPTGFPIPQGHRFQLVLVTHDESTFYANNCRKNLWNHKTDKATPQRKGEGPSIMISDMVTVDWEG